MESRFFNTFMDDHITQGPGSILWIVAASAVVAMLTTTVRGILSDRTRGRFGQSKTFILFG